jgi:hypothetical protein
LESNGIHKAPNERLGFGFGSGKSISSQPVGCSESLSDPSHDRSSSSTEPKPQQLSPPDERKREVHAAVRRVWDYYVMKLSKNPKLLSLTEKREQKGLARFQEALAKTGEDLSKAEELMRMAVDALASSPFHTGDNDRHKHYDSWEKNLFSSQERFEVWLEEAACE